MIADRLVSPRVNAGMEKSYREVAIEDLLKSEAQGGVTVAKDASFE
jgi:hypothetical protein